MFLNFSPTFLTRTQDEYIQWNEGVCGLFNNSVSSFDNNIVRRY
jgi:hypothetical protein